MIRCWNCENEVDDIRLKLCPHCGIDLVNPFD